MRGGKREGAGRRKGSMNRRTKQTVAMAEAAGQLPLEFMLEVMRDPNESDDLRFRMAVAAAPFCHARLAAVACKEPALELSDLTDDELKSLVKFCDQLDESE